MADNDEGPLIETISFPFDRMTVQRFRETFPRARWNESLQAWTVPGKTARRRLDRWFSREADRADSHADQKGRDAYEWEPILSPYLDVIDFGFRIRTPYSRTVVDELRQVPYARWDGEQKAWLVPFGSYDELQHRWETIEEAAKRNEPEERRKRAEARKVSDEEARARRRSSERKRCRIPLPSDDLPPIERPIATSVYGIVVITEVTGELVEPETVAEFYPEADEEDVWCTWRLSSLEELVHTWPARTSPGDYERLRGWWQPTLDELRDARKSARAIERRRSTSK